MSVRGAGSISKYHVPKVATPKPPKLSIKGPTVPKMRTPGMPKIPTLPSLEVQARRGEAPKLALAKAAAGATSNRSKRNSYFPTP